MKLIKHMRELFVFPNEIIIRYLVGKKSDKIIDIVLNGTSNVKNTETIAFYSKDTFYIKPDEQYNVFPCNEEALYWISNLNVENFNFSFSNILLKLLSKESFKKYLMGSAIRTGYMEEYNSAEIESPIIYPIIAKPSFGFGSIGVKRLFCTEDLFWYKKFFPTLLNLPQYAEFKNEYFPNYQNLIVYEKDLKGNFYTVPFVVESNRLIKLFPIRGIKCEKNFYTDFFLSQFAIGVQYFSGDDFNKVESLIEKLISIFSLQSGIFTAEIIVSDFAYLIEFSPRLPGGKLQELIFKSMKIDLNHLFVSLCLHTNLCIEEYGVENKKLIYFTSEERNKDNYYRTVFGQYLSYRIE